jgi:hypothetical protein
MQAALVHYNLTLMTSSERSADNYRQLAFSSSIGMMVVVDGGGRAHLPVIAWQTVEGIVRHQTCNYLWHEGKKWKTTKSS